MRALGLVTLATAILGGCTSYDYTPASSHPVDQAPAHDRAPDKDAVRIRVEDVPRSGLRPQARLRLSRDKVLDDDIPLGLRMSASAVE
jgi:hypothetical protein